MFYVATVSQFDKCIKVWKFKPKVALTFYRKSAHKNRKQCVLIS